MHTETQNNVNTRPLDGHVERARTSLGCGEADRFAMQWMESDSWDGHVLELLEASLRKYRPTPDTEPSHQQALAKCIELQAERELQKVRSALGAGDTDLASRILQPLIQPPFHKLPERSRPAALELCVNIAWVSREWSNSINLLASARRLDHAEAYGPYLNKVERLLEARQSLRNGQYARAIGQSYSLIHETRAEDPLQVLGLELMAAGLRALKDPQRECATLESWESKFKCYPNGPCDEAVRVEARGDDVGIMDRSRAEEIRRNYSRLGRLRQRDPDQRALAVQIYENFMNVGLHEWIDTEAPAEGSIRQRLAALEEGRDTSASGATDRQPVTVIEPLHRYGRITEAAIPEITNALDGFQPGTMAAVTIHTLRIREREFEYDPELGDPLEQLKATLEDLLETNPSQGVGFTVRRWRISGIEGVHMWLSLARQEPPPGLLQLSFGIQATSMGNRFTLTVRLIFDCVAPIDPISQRRLEDYLARERDSWSELAALEAEVGELAVRCARRVSQRSPAGTAGKIQLEGIQEL